MLATCPPSYLALLQNFRDRAFVFHGEENDIFVREFLKESVRVHTDAATEFVLLESDGSLQ